MPSRPGISMADVAAVAAPLAVGGIGSLVTTPAIPTWYRTLDKPEWKPPDVAFGPVWTALYLLMGVALAMIRRAPSEERGPATAVFGLQLALNLAWSIAFFGGRSTAAGANVIVLLWVAILATIAQFARVRRIAALLLLPYLAWVTFATALNLEIWRRNPD